jgi:hypothetical protein
MPKSARRISARCRAHIAPTLHAQRSATIAEAPVQTRVAAGRFQLQKRENALIGILCRDLDPKIKFRYTTASRGGVLRASTATPL